MTDPAAVPGAGKGLLGAEAGAGAVDGERVEEAVGLDEPIYCVCRQIGFGEMVREVAGRVDPVDIRGGAYGLFIFYSHHIG